ncbi:MAG: energy transducer TonB [Emcibacter sp.]|nr:energy transducer TonB [Emcibacter sp.]
MSRLFITILSFIIILMPASILADEKADQKSEILNLHKVYKTTLKAGNIDEALGIAEQIYALTPGAYGKISKTHATATFNLGQVSKFARKRHQAAQYFQEHMDILDDLGAAKDQKYLFKLDLLSKAHSEAGNNEKAIKYARMGLDLAKELQVSDEMLADQMLGLGIYYSMSHKHSRQARRFVNKAHELFSKTLGDQHHKTAFAIFWQAKIYMAYKKPKRAAEKFEKTLAVYKDQLPAGHDRTLQVHAFLVGAYEKMGKTDRATEHCIAVATERTADFDREIKPLYKIRPKYPRSAAMSGKSGHIIAEFVVDEFGQVKDIKTLYGENIKIFEKEAHEALSKFRYAPSTKDGIRVKTEGVLHRITFKMAK